MTKSLASQSDPVEAPRAASTGLGVRCLRLHIFSRACSSSIVPIFALFAPLLWSTIEYTIDRRSLVADDTYCYRLPTQLMWLLQV